MLQTTVLQPGTLAHLKSMMLNPELNQFTLVGGTALALQLGHRLSIDLDFFTPEKFSHDTILYEVQALGTVKELFRNKIMLQISLDEVKLDFVYYPYPFIWPVKMINTFRLASMEEIAAMKLSAITNRGVRKDFFDLFFLLKQFSMKQIIGFYIDKYTDRNYFQMSKSLTYFDDAEQTESPVILKGNVIWPEVKKTIEKAVKDFL
jgi:predicted nucleotidyltransferase component of viral defense system